MLSVFIHPIMYYWNVNDHSFVLAQTRKQKSMVELKIKHQKPGSFVLVGFVQRAAGARTPDEMGL